MGARRTEYQIVGRYMDGKEVTAYHLQSLETGKAGRYSRDQVIYLVGRGQVTNCSGQIYQDKVLLRGIGISLENLPVQQENGTLKNTGSIGHVRRGATGSDVMTQVILVAALTNGRNVIGYKVKNAGGGETQISREQLLQLARDGRVGNARVQMYQGKPILKGVNCDLKQLPKIDVNGASSPANSTSSKVYKYFNAFSNEIGKSVTKLSRPMHKTESTSTFNKWEYDAGYISLQLTDANSGAFEVDWSASNGFDGGELSGIFEKDLEELKDYIKKAISRIHTMQIH